MACPGGGLRCGVPGLPALQEGRLHRGGRVRGTGQRMLSGEWQSASLWVLTIPDFLPTLSGTATVILCPLRFLHPPGLPLCPPSWGCEGGRVPCRPGWQPQLWVPREGVSVSVCKCVCRAGAGGHLMTRAQE